MQLHNRVNRDELKQLMMADQRPYCTISFYKYYPIANPSFLRNHMYLALREVECVGRIYIAEEGINAQVSVPQEKFEQMRVVLNNIDFLQNIRLNTAVEEKRSTKSFVKLDIKVRPKIVADGINDPDFNPYNNGKYLPAEDWNVMIDQEDTVVIDMRNHYESEVGRFEKATCPDVDTFKEELDVVIETYKDAKGKPILMYCTGGIRCEKASAWMKHKGFNNVFHLEGGIINYVNNVREKGLENKFKGVNFVFDERLAERISEDVLATCHQCGNAADTHVNCSNIGCHTLFIQCSECKELYNGCCSNICKDVLQLPQDEQITWRKNNLLPNNFTKGRKVKAMYNKM
jgi:UPF0176 protein